MKARFETRPQEVEITMDGNTVYCQIALNAQEVEVKDPETEETHKEWECDLNTFYGHRYDIDTDDVRDNPEKYIDFKIESVSGSEQRLRDIETALAELGEIIGG